MQANMIERMRYYQRQFLGAEDFQDEQAYHRDMRRRHNLGAHTWGIVAGLRLIQVVKEGTADEYDVFVQPGMAVDGYGREIVVLAPSRLDASQFSFSAAAGYQDVWIGFRDEATLQPAFGYAVCAEDEDGNQARRWLETFEIYVAPAASTVEPEGVIIDGDATPASKPPPYKQGDPLEDPPPSERLRFVPGDNSAPYQELPDDNSDDPLWLIKLGSVNWDGKNSRFVQSAAERLNEDRRYLGVVADTLYAPDATLTLRHRVRPLVVQSGNRVFDPDAQELAQIEGRLRVDGRIVAKDDEFLWGGKLSFQSEAGPAPGGEEDAIPLWLRRRAADGNTDLHVHLGDDASAGDDKPSARTRLTIGPKDGANEKAVLAVKANDVVEIRTGELSFGRKTRQMLNLWSKGYGLGVQAATMYFRSDFDFCWFRGGTHDDAQSQPGTNGQLSMRLDSQGRLHFGERVRQMVNLWRANYGIGVQDWTLYFRTDADVCWFRGGQESPARGDAGAGGTLAMKLDGGNQLSVFGPLSVQNSANIGGDLRAGGKIAVQGDATNIFKVVTYDCAVKNSGQNSARNWSIDYSGRFSQVYTVFAVLRGVSLFSQVGGVSVQERGSGDAIQWGANAAFHVRSSAGDTVAQHVFVNVNSYNSNTVNLSAYCSEAQVTLEADNCLLVTVVVLGRGLA